MAAILRSKSHIKLTDFQKPKTEETVITLTQYYSIYTVE